MASNTPSQNGDSDERSDISDVLVIDFFTELHSSYREAIPSERRVHFATNCQDGLRTLNDDVISRLRGAKSSIRTVVIQGMSLYHSAERFENYMNTVGFIRSVRNTGYKGVVFIVSQSLQWQQRDHLQTVARESGVSVVITTKTEFFRVTARQQDPQLRTMLDERAIWDMWYRFDRYKSSHSEFLRAMCEWPELALTWLQEFKCSLRDKSLSGMLHHLVQLGITPIDGGCDCDPVIKDATDEEVLGLGWEAIHHDNHAAYNRAVLSLLNDNLVLKMWLIVELLDDSSVDHPEFEGFGRQVRKHNARQLLEFLGYTEGAYGSKEWSRRWVSSI